MTFENHCDPVDIIIVAALYARYIDSMAHFSLQSLASLPSTSNSSNVHFVVAVVFGVRRKISLNISHVIEYDAGNVFVLKT